eukprot:11164928-Lingulodinium_polyedra.AAC.1
MAGRGVRPRQYRVQCIKAPRQFPLQRPLGPGQPQFEYFVRAQGELLADKQQHARWVSLRVAMGQELAAILGRTLEQA